MKALCWAFVVALVQRVASQYALGLFWVGKFELIVFSRLLTDHSGLAYFYLAL